MIGVYGFIGRVQKITGRNPKYRTGGVGKDGTCDCIGLIMGAMYELGHKKYDLHSTNYIARYQTMEMVTLKSSTDIYPGMILYKARDDQDRLNGRYLPGGRYYTGDVLDYYHVGVVVRAKPLEIVECTEYGNTTGIVRSSAIKGWNYGGKLRGVLYDGYEESKSTDAREEETMDVLYRAVVTTKSGSLNIRERPAVGNVLTEVPKGETVEVIAEYGDGWPKVRYGNAEGYASQRYLEKIDESEMTENVPDLNMAVTIIDSEGHRFMPVGDFRVLFGNVD